MKSRYVWGACRGHLAHLFAHPYYCVTSLCGSARAGDNNLRHPTKRKRCKLCERLADTVTVEAS